jgi:hypothetical protein
LTETYKRSVRSGPEKRKFPNERTTYVPTRGRDTEENSIDDGDERGQRIGRNDQFDETVKHAVGLEESSL